MGKRQRYPRKFRCEVCDGLFEAKRKAYYCSPKCRQKGSRSLRHAARAKATLHDELQRAINLIETRGPLFALNWTNLREYLPKDSQK